MGLPADVTIDHDTPPVRGNDYVVQINALVDEVRTLRTGLAALAVAYNALAIKADSVATAYNATLAKLDGDAGVTSTDYAATHPAVTTFASGNTADTTAYAADTTHKAAKLKH